MTNYDWADLAFASKKPIKDLQAIFIAAPREISVPRFKQLIKDYLPQGNIVLGVAKEKFIDGFADQPQFKTLDVTGLQSVIDSLNKAGTKHTITTLDYFQRELPFIIGKIGFKKVLLINGSWQHVFHVSPTFYELTKHAIPYELLSPFTDETEAKNYAQKLQPQIAKHTIVDMSKSYEADELLGVVQQVAKRSYDYSFQTGAVLAKSTKNKYKPLLAAHNQVVPYETYALHHGTSRERFFAPPNDLNHYDTVHAEMSLLVQAAEAKLNLTGSSLFINLMPCPTCARSLSQTSIKEVIYQQDHSDGYAVRLLEAVGKTVRRQP